MEKPLEHLTKLLTMMSTEPEFNYWDPDNTQLKLKDEMIPSWVAAFSGIEALVMAYYIHHPELTKKGGQSEQIEQNEVANPHDEGSERSDPTEGSNE